MIKVPTGIYINGVEQFIEKSEEDLQSMSGLKAMLKSAREEAARYRILAREKEEKRVELEELEAQITYYKELYYYWKNKCNSKPALIYTDDLFNKPNNTMKEQNILTEDVERYQFRGKPELKIVEIQIPKTEELRNHNFGYKVWYKHANNQLDWTSVNKYGNRSQSYESPWDVILKPVPKTRPMTHEEIMELRAKGAVFRNNFWKVYEFVTLNGYAKSEYLLGGCWYHSETILNSWLYSLDNCATWLPLTKEDV